MRWNLVMCGSRRKAYERFMERAAVGSDEFIVLLVDSEEAVIKAPKTHLAARTGDEWTDLKWTSEKQVHLMVQTMETWLIADVETLRSYYCRQFKGNVLPKRQDLEKVPKANVSSALSRATRKTRKGEYHKIWHASDLLSLVDPERTKERCRHCKRLFDTLISVIDAA